MVRSSLIAIFLYFFGCPNVRYQRTSEQALTQNPEHYQYLLNCVTAT